MGSRSRIRKAGGMMSIEMPLIIILLAANALWFIVGWARGYKEAETDREFNAR